SEFVKLFEEKFDVTAAAPAAVVAAAPAGGGGGEAAVEEEKDEFDVILESAGDKKIQVIKEVRGLTNLGLKDAKDLVVSAPKPVLEVINKESAENAKAAFEGAGATVTLSYVFCGYGGRLPLAGRPPSLSSGLRHGESVRERLRGRRLGRTRQWAREPSTTM